MMELIDQFGRRHTDLRISVIDKCSLRCSYCMPDEFQDWIPQDDQLTLKEIVEVVEVATSLGVSTVRLTGGEPLLHPQIIEIVAAITAISQPPQISMTTNGIKLAKLASRLVDAGLGRVNISLDTLRPERFQRITRRDKLNSVLEGIEAARSAGLSPVKINSVLLRGINDDEATDLLDFAITKGLELRFIEQMPLDAGHIWRRIEFVKAEEIELALRKKFHLEPMRDRGSSPAEEFIVDNGRTKVGIIASVTRPFCGSCNRLRLTADGQIRNCLFANSENDVRSILRNSMLSSEDRQNLIKKVFMGSVTSKMHGHGINEPGFIQPIRPMSAIGG